MGGCEDVLCMWFGSILIAHILCITVPLGIIEGWVGVNCNNGECGLQSVVLCEVLNNTVEELMLPVDVLPPSAFTSSVQTKSAAC